MINVGLLLVKCYLVESKEDSAKKAHETLETCERRLRNSILKEVKNLRKRLT